MTKIKKNILQDKSIKKCFHSNYWLEIGYEEINHLQKRCCYSKTLLDSTVVCNYQRNYIKL